MSVTVVLRRRPDADDFDFLHFLEDATLDTTGGNSAATFDVEHVFDGHQERLIDWPLGSGMYSSTAVHEICDRLLVFGHRPRAP